MKTDVYSWRLSSDLKSDLERRARESESSISQILESAVKDWLTQTSNDASTDQEDQMRLHAAVENCIGSICGSDSRRSENAKENIQQRLKKRYARPRSH